MIICGERFNIFLFFWHCIAEEKSWLDRICSPGPVTDLILLIVKWRYRLSIGNQ